MQQSLKPNTDICFFDNISHTNFCKVEGIELIGLFVKYYLEDIQGLPLTYSKIRSKALLGQIVDVVYHLREKGVLHNDLRPLNILVNGDSIKIIDVEHCFPWEYPVQISHWQASAPEIKSLRPHRNSDLFSLGMCFAYLVLKEQFDRAIKEDFSAAFPKMLDGIDDSLVMIIRLLTERNPEQRYVLKQDILKAITLSNIL